MTILFSSKWDNATTGDANLTQNDGGNWYQCEITQAFYDAGARLTRVSGDQSGIGNGGPSGVPSGSGATNYLRISMVNLADHFGPSIQSVHNDWTEKGFDHDYNDLYMGVWCFFENGFQFYDSVKFLDFRTHHQDVGNGHLALFGFNYNCRGCTNKGTGADNNSNQDTAPTQPTAASWPNDHSLGMFRYKYAAAESTHEYHWNWWNAAQFDQNMASGSPVSSEGGYDIDTPTDRILSTGNVWMAYIVHAKIHATDAEFDAWIKKGTDSLTRVMQWNRNTVWDTPNVPHDLYSLNGVSGIDHTQLSGYWNNYTHAGTQYAWYSNYIVATTYDDVATYLGVEEDSTSQSPSKLQIKNITRAQNPRKIHPKF